MSRSSSLSLGVPAPACCAAAGFAAGSSLAPCSGSAVRNAVVLDRRRRQ
jgi:hypothetical protein